MPSLPIDTATEGRGSIKQRLDKIDAAIAYLRTATTTVGRAAIDAGKSLIISGGGGLEVRDAGSIKSTYPDGSTSTVYGGVNSINGNRTYGFRVLGAAATAPRQSLVFAANQNGQQNALGYVQIGAPGNEVAPYFYVRAGTMEQYADYASLTAHQQIFLTAGDESSTSTPAVGITPSGVNVYGPITFGNVGTSGAAANLVFDPTTGSVLRSTSSRRYKRDIKTADIKTADVLALVPRTFRTKVEVEKLGDAAPVRAGFIAEEAYDAGLHWWVRCDDEGPESFDYASFSVAQQAVIREQATAIEKLQKQVAALSKKLGL